MTATASEDDRLAELLGEALRRGPGSPEWHDAVERLRTSDVEADDAHLLFKARERLAGGKEFRSVRAGPAFTESLFRQLGATTGAPRSKILRAATIATATAIVLSAGALVVVTSRGSSNANEALAEQLFIAPVHQYAFLRPGGAQMELDKTWHVDRTAGLRPSAPTESQRLELPKPLDLARPVCVECVLNVGKLADTRFALIATGSGGNGSRIEMELSRAGVAAVRGSTTDQLRREIRSGTCVLRLKLNQEQAVAEIDGKPVWAGPVDLGDAARLAIEFRSVGRDTQAVRVEAVRVLGVAPEGGRP